MSETPQETISRLRELLARTYRAAVKPEWQEGECLDEVLGDVLWEGIDVLKLEAEAAKGKAVDEPNAEIARLHKRLGAAHEQLGFLLALYDDATAGMIQIPDLQREIMVSEIRRACATDPEGEKTDG